MEDFNMELLLKEVEIRNLLWDTKDENYGKRPEMTEAWAEVCRSLFPDFDKRNLKDRYATEEFVKNKYKNARDNFVRKMRTGSTKCQHEESLMFLKEMYEAKMKNDVKKNESHVSKNLKLRRKRKSLNRNKSSKQRNAQVRNTSVSQINLRTEPTDPHQEPKDHYQEPTPSSSDENDENSSTKDDSLRASKRGKFNQDEEVPNEKNNIISYSSFFTSHTDQDSLETDDETKSNTEKPLIQSGTEKQLQTVLNYCPSNLSIVSFMAQEEADEDLAFLKSLLIWLKKFNEDEKLEFRSEVLKLIQKIRNSEGYY